MAEGKRRSAQVIRLAERRAVALSLRKQGGSYREIAEVIRGQDGASSRYDHTLARLDVLACLKEINETMAEDASEVRRLELERLDELHATVYGKALEGDYNAFDRVLSLMDRRARLTGIMVAPPATPVPIVGFDGGPVQFRMVTVLPPALVEAPANGSDRAE